MNSSNLLIHSDFNQLAHGRDGYYLYNKNDIYIGQAIENYGEFSHLEMEILKQLCTFGSIVIEVGANIGAHTVGLAKHIGSKGKLFAFEPQRIIFQTLCANMALNSLENVVCHWAALSDQTGTITIPEPNPHQLSNFGGVTLLGVENGYPTPALTLDSFTTLSDLHLIKIDVEGMEAHVLRGGIKLIQTFQPILYLENDRVPKSKALMELIDSLDYKMFWHTPPLYNPDNFYGKKDNIYQNLYSFNMLCIPKNSSLKIEGFTEITDFSHHPLLK